MSGVSSGSKCQERVPLLVMQKQPRLGPVPPTMKRLLSETNPGAHFRGHAPTGDILRVGNQLREKVTPEAQIEVDRLLDVITRTKLDTKQRPLTSAQKDERREAKQILVEAALKSMIGHVMTQAIANQNNLPEDIGKNIDSFSIQTKDDLDLAKQKVSERELTHKKITSGVVGGAMMTASAVVIPFVPYLGIGGVVGAGVHTAQKLLYPNGQQGGPGINALQGIGGSSAGSALIATPNAFMTMGGAAVGSAAAGAVVSYGATALLDYGAQKLRKKIL